MCKLPFDIDGGTVDDLLISASNSSSLSSDWKLVRCIFVVVEVSTFSIAVVGVEVNVDVIWSIVYGFGVVISIIASAVVFSGSTSAFVLDWIQYCRLEATFQSEIVVCRLDCLFCMIRKIDFVYCAV